MDDYFEQDFNEVEIENPGLTYHELHNGAEQDGQGKKYVCVSCDKHYQAINMLHDHMKEHDVKSKFQCEVENCSKTFSAEAHLQKHQKAHTQQRSFPCNFENCDQKFNLKSNLKRHERTHTNDKPFICHDCKKGFVTTTNLKQHLQVHKGKNNRQIFECSFDGCNKKYFYRCNLNKHKKQDHQGPEVQICSPEDVSIGATFNKSRVSFHSSSPTSHSKDLLVTYKKIGSCSEQCVDCFDKDQGVYAYDQAKMVQDPNAFVTRVLDEAKQRQIVNISIEVPADPEIKILNLYDSMVKYLSTLTFNPIVSVSFYNISKEDMAKITENTMQRLLKIK